ncbi:Na+/H+ antiporter subunit E [Lysinibacillus fusiformis]|jgi:multicomponent Na+:H+ antiporter subunit E|uniref:Na(+)/H(+) antiporter subunit E (Multiple resistance and pH homeostasis protein E) (Mrp complex subunit E) n=4 Tax=Lysinibacillus TaxID=400634 RepID=B1HXJ4_LYSSC|nr:MULTISPECIES: Na+/H+ antiporter subunit E [Lysinibacillus]MBE5086382.1 Na+/H+ antiporter subunit E [Bacillus thuringiensis]UZM99669.1 Na+/H+ antiporter subunit E [Lysinibacillus sp. MHQ-1]ACA38289.1 Na(+)/H(+) antiporter subunit E (Multiple resistance and pH homeostasis protein E) (Mrp complex subunit E) [Lysinibacillus sphaericus C3-41]AJK89805.1 monovalent cation/H+ antiporter subunit E [Lysinibacillus fusiformis]AMO31407.1 cation:proton antiporter [Lysinibacillus sphaericus]
MAMQFILNLFIAALWLLLQDEVTPQFSTFLMGFIVGMGILYAMHRFYGTQFYLRRVFSIIKLLWLFNWELFLSSYSVLKQITTPKLNITPGIFTYKTALKGDWEITALALLLTLTPGSVVMEVSEEGDVFYIHAMDIEQSKDAVIRSIGKFEQAIMEVTR